MPYSLIVPVGANCVRPKAFSSGEGAEYTRRMRRLLQVGANSVLLIHQPFGWSPFSVGEGFGLYNYVIPINYNLRRLYFNVDLKRNKGYNEFCEVFK